MKNQIGVITSLKANTHSLAALKTMRLKTCQLCGWAPDLWTTALAKRVQKEMRKDHVHVTAFWAGWTGPGEWNFTYGPATLGLVPATYRHRRMEQMIRAADFAHAIGLRAIITHLGFIPENPQDPVFHEVVAAVRNIAIYLEQRGMEFWFETGQETPVTMLRLIQAVGTPNMGINLDPANLIMYGKANPIDALDVFGSYVRNIHAKDGLYPTDPMKLGKEVKVGKGRVRFPDFVRRLGEIGFTGEFIIEREISGEQQKRDIAETITYLQRLLKFN